MKTLIGVFLMGTVDSIDNDSVRVELIDVEYRVTDRIVPLTTFPCYIVEGDMFYIEYSDNSAVLRCGEPPS